MTRFQSFSGKDLYPTLATKASILFYLMIKNHPFQNGNKRIAITTLLTFLYENGKWILAIIAEESDFYTFAKSNKGCFILCNWLSWGNKIFRRVH